MANELTYWESNGYPEHQAQDRNENQSGRIRVQNGNAEKSHTGHFEADIHLLQAYHRSRASI